MWCAVSHCGRYLAVNMEVQASIADSGALRSVRVPNLKLRSISVAFWHSAASAASESGAVQAPTHHRRFDDAAGLMIAPFAIDPPARERQLINSAVVLA